ncbi:M16 family metallopeptidase [Clostridium oryzae]|uniref:Putative zinc protease AlbF n=1 Tax=Clostridium oryzae TaxID=1450648 RepID=A0A1V4IFQ6_9CLOT|nr:pitrilysin family protein [Clostridium oryzae]OPJ58495.1 putative zinc protease AlbF [Clostridium oryzae]
MSYKYFDTRECRLKNGLRVVSIKKETGLFSLNFGVKVGSAYENNEERGIAHFIEHMLFKGTLKRNNEELNRELEYLGGSYNAYTDYTCTVFTITALKDEIEQAIELLADMAINSNFDEAEITKEKGVVISEFDASEDDLEGYSFKMVNKIAFSKSPLKYDIIGTKESIKSISRHKIEDFYKKFYVPNNCCITIVSSLEHNQVISIIDKYFAKWQQENLQPIFILNEKNKHVLKVNYRSNIEQSTITYLYTFYDLKKEEELALKILNHRLGESTNSILFRELREKRGLAYDVYTHLDISDNVRTLYIFTAVKDKNVEDSIKIIDAAIRDLKINRQGIDEEIMLLMKKVLKTEIEAMMENSEDFGEYVLQQCLENEDIYSFEKDLEAMDKITVEQIYDVAVKVLEKPSVHILKQKNRGEDYEK